MIIDIDNTRRNTFTTCPRKYYWRWEQFLTSSWGSTALRYGSVIHKGLETYYESFLPSKRSDAETIALLGKVGEAMTKEWEDITFSGEGEQQKKFYSDHRTLQTALQCITEYIMHYEAEWSYLNLLSVEQSFTIPLPLSRAYTVWPVEICDKVREVNFIGRIDGIIDMGGLYVLEHKTTSLPVEKAIDTLYRTAQMIGYTYALRYLNPESTVIGCMANIIQMPALRAKKDGTYGNPSFNFVRSPQVYTQQHLDTWLDSMLMRAGQIALCRSTNNFPMEYDGCYTYNSPCPYTSLCASQEQDVTKVNTAHFITDYWDPRNEDKK
jgi:hypothetical protein